MAFDASVQVVPLDYDFTMFVPGAQGTIPEPTEQQVHKFERAIQKLSNQYKDMSTEDMAKYLENVTEEEYNKNREASLDAAEIVCGKTPSREEIDALPMRIKQKFYGWLVRELLRPEPSADGTTL